MKPHTEIIGELRSDYAANARKYFSKGKHYPDFLLFFQEQIAEKGWEETVMEFVFKGDALADELFGRLYSGRFNNYQLSRTTQLMCILRLPPSHHPAHVRGRVEATCHHC